MKRSHQIALSSADPLATLVGGVVMILGGLGLIEKWGLSADDVAMIGGGVLSIAAVGRSMLERGRN